MHSTAVISATALGSLLDRVLRINQYLGQCVECETAWEDMHSTRCRTAAAILEARFALMSVRLRDAAWKGQSFD
jgi:hypothetical protein